MQGHIEKEDYKKKFLSDVKAKVKVSIIKDGKWYVAVDKITNTATQAKSKKEVIRMLCEALSLYYEDYMPKVERKSNLNLERHTGCVNRNVALQAVVST